MTDTPGSDHENDHDSHHSGAEDGSSKLHAVKDRECQYCHQKFTSSSLGRHLDQFLNKKKPDGIHNVDEIRRLRGNITRRTARNSSKQDHDESRATNSNASPAPTGEGGQHSPVVDTLNAVPANGIGMRINSMNWHSTGVINNVKDIISMPIPIGSPVGTPLSGKRNYSTFAGIEQPTTRNTAAENEKDSTIRALELSLREVLDSVQAATARASPRPSPFNFDLQTQTFPSLVLQLLPTPPTLFSASPFATSTSAPLSPPDSSHLPLLRLNLETQIQTWKWEALAHAQSQTFPTEHSQNLGEEADYLSHTATKYEDLARKHLDAAFQAWRAHSLEDRTEKWCLELTRAYARQKQRYKELEEKFDVLTAEANRLQGQVEHLSRCQWPRELALWPPEPRRFGKIASSEIRGIRLEQDTMEEGVQNPKSSGGSGSGDGDISAAERWDFERLVAKWRRRVREDRSRRSGMAATGVPAMSGGRVNELLREESSVTPPPPLNGGSGNGSGNGETRKSIRQIQNQIQNQNQHTQQQQQQQQQQQHLAIDTANQDERVRDFNRGLEAMNH